MKVILMPDVIAAKLQFRFSLKMNNLLLGGCNLVTKVLFSQANHSCSSKNKGVVAKYNGFIASLEVKVPPLVVAPGLCKFLRHISTNI